MRQLILELHPEIPPSLDNFVAGANGEALTGLAAWLSPDNRESSLLLWGEIGAGKTHLLRASCADLEATPTAAVSRGAAGAIYSDAAGDPDLASIDTVGAVYDFVALDNVEALSERGQIALFKLFNDLRASGGRLLTAATQAPLHLKLREDLRTRLGSGLIYRVQTLSDAEKIEALATQAKARSMRLPGEALTYLLAHAPRDMRSLTALLAGLDRYSLEQKRPITMPLLREVLQASAPTTETNRS